MRVDCISQSLVHLVQIVVSLCVRMECFDDGSEGSVCLCSRCAHFGDVVQFIPVPLGGIFFSSHIDFVFIICCCSVNLLFVL